MSNKVIWGFIVVGIVGVLIYGAVNRTLDKTVNAAGTRTAQNVAQSDDDQVQNGTYGRQNQSNNAGSQGGRGYNRNQGNANEQTTSEDTDAQNQRGSGNGYGRQGEESNQETGRGQGQGYGQGVQQRDGENGYNTPLAEEEEHEWSDVKGTAVETDDNSLRIQTEDQTLVEVADRPWLFAQEAGFEVEPGDEILLKGFYEDGEFKVGSLSNITSGLLTEIREESGRPLWAGRGRRARE